MDIRLAEIARNTARKASFQAVISGVGSSLKNSFQPPLIVEQGCTYEIALINLETYYAFPNIEEGQNNELKVFYKKWYSIKIPTGSYELASIDLEIQRQVLELTAKKDLIRLTPNRNTFKCIMTLDKGVQVDFNQISSISSVLGFEKKIYKGPRNESEKVVNIMRVNSILVHCNLIESSYLNGIQKPVLYGFFPATEPGTKIIERPPNPIYLPVSLDQISVIDVWLTDQDGTALNLPGETLTIKIHIRTC